ncbi:phosphoenolpyruvate-utilizing N-terminal domain-containing protein [Vibrio sp. 10N.261.51.F12]|uniref:phosphoenolpyruvate-utilizing N-terminal domain-containing protein n=1 Tax=Vibrio sp. 10N.261.51.F12 TaxID=3229679 RepID=UPI0035523FEF
MNVIVTPIALAKAIKKHTSTHIKSHYKDEIDKYDVAMGTLFQKMGLLGSEAQYEAKPELAKVFERHATALLKPENQAAIKENIRRNVYSADTVVDELVHSFVDVIQQLNVADYSNEALRFESMRKDLLKRLLGSEFSPQHRDSNSDAGDSSTLDVTQLLERVNNSTILAEYYRGLDARTTDNIEIDLVFSLENKQRSMVPANILISSSKLNLNDKQALSALDNIDMKAIRLDIDYREAELEPMEIAEELRVAASLLKSQTNVRQVRGILNLEQVKSISPLRCSDLDTFNRAEDLSVGVQVNAKTLPFDPSVLPTVDFVVLEGMDKLLDWEFSSLQTFYQCVQSMIKSGKSVSAKITSQVDKRLIVLAVGMGIRGFYINESSGARFKSVIRYLSYAEMEALTLAYLAVTNEADARDIFRRNRFLESIVSD